MDLYHFTCNGLTWSKVGGTQFTAYMSLFNLSGVTAYLLTERMIEIFDYSSAIYVGATLTMISAIMLIFIDEDETDRVLEGRLGDEDEDEWWTEEENQWRVLSLASMQQWLDSCGTDFLMFSQTVCYYCTRAKNVLDIKG